MSSISSHDTAVSDSALQRALTLQRHICLLRHQGRHTEAESQTLGQLQPAIAEILSQGNLSREQLDRTLAAETERVKNAALLAALLVPMLRDATGLELGASPKPAASKQTSPTAPPPPRRNPTDITSFIDEMLAQPGSRSRT